VDEGSVRLKIFIRRVQAYVAVAFLSVALRAYGNGGVAGGCTVLLDSGWRFYFAGNDSGCAPAKQGPTSRYAAVTIPHTFYQTSSGRQPTTGFGWYYRDIDIPASFSGRDLFLDFEGAGLRTVVYINGKTAGGCAFPYLPFSVDCTPFDTATGPLRCAVRVDSRFMPRQIPDHRAKGWWRYGGLFREVCLRARPKERIADARVRTCFREGDTFDCHLTLKPSRTLWDSVAVAIAPLDSTRVVYRGVVHGTDTLLRLGGVRAWTPEAPFMHVFSLVPFFKGKPGDTLRLKRGFCQLTARGPGLFLNGRPYYLRGSGRHDERGGKGPLLSRKDRLRDLVDLKSLGVNFLRAGHFPQHRDIYELCDSLGMLVMDEIPLWKTGSRFLASKKGREYGASYMEALVSAHGNHTCVCLWSLGNQFGSYRNSVAAYVDTVAAAVRKADPSRLVTFCSIYYVWDKAFSSADVISVNEYFGWELASLPMLGPMLDKINKDWPDRPVIVSELGAQSKKGLRNPRARLAGAIKSIYSKDLSEDHQALFMRSHMDTIWSKRSFVSGMVVWAYADYMTCQHKARTADMPLHLNACGIVTRDREKKMSYDVVKERYASYRRIFMEESRSP
jgi:hypothetical protein